jgi:hypothetical protein
MRMQNVQARISFIVICRFNISRRDTRIKPHPLEIRIPSVFIHYSYTEPRLAKSSRLRDIVSKERYMPGIMSAPDLPEVPFEAI